MTSEETKGLADQLRELAAVAISLGLYEASEWIVLQLYGPLGRDD